MSKEFLLLGLVEGTVTAAVIAGTGRDFRLVTASRLVMAIITDTGGRLVVAGTGLETLDRLEGLELVAEERTELGNVLRRLSERLYLKNGKISGEIRFVIVLEKNSTIFGIL